MGFEFFFGEGIRVDTFGILINRLMSICFELNRITSGWTKLRAGIWLFYDDKEWAEASGLWRQFAPPAFTGIGYRHLASMSGQSVLAFTDNII